MKIQPYNSRDTPQIEHSPDSLKHESRAFFIITERKTSWKQLFLMATIHDLIWQSQGWKIASRVHRGCGCSTSLWGQIFNRSKQRKGEMAMSSISVASKNRTNIAPAQEKLKIRLKISQKSLKTLIKSTFLACHLFRSLITKNTENFVLGIFLSKPQAWHIIDARSASYIISPCGAVSHSSRASVHPPAAWWYTMLRIDDIPQQVADDIHAYGVIWWRIP